MPDAPPPSPPKRLPELAQIGWMVAFWVGLLLAGTLVVQQLMPRFGSQGAERRIPPPAAPTKAAEPAASMPSGRPRVQDLEV